VLTTRHHDGFCLWDSKTTISNAARIGPQRDLLKPFVEAVRKEGLKVGFYYSFADWSHPDYPDAYARDWPTHWPIQQSESASSHSTGPAGRIDDRLRKNRCALVRTAAFLTHRRRRHQRADLRAAATILVNERNGVPFDFECAEQSLKPSPAPGKPVSRSTITGLPRRRSKLEIRAPRLLHQLDHLRTTTAATSCSTSAHAGTASSPRNPKRFFSPPASGSAVIVRPS